MRVTTFFGPVVGLALSVLNILLMTGFFTYVFFATVGSGLVSLAVAISSSLALWSRSQERWSRRVVIAFICSSVVAIFTLLNLAVIATRFVGSLPITTLLSALMVIPSAVTIVWLATLPRRAPATQAS
jgi:hypothetical protein